MAGKNKESRIHLFYRIENSSATPIKRDCPRCGKGVFMAEHKDRLTCGKCGYTEFKHRKVE